MPELPEVETMVRGIRPYVEGRRILALRTCRCAFKPIAISPRRSQLARRTRGQTVSRVRRLGKRIVFDLSSGETLVIEPRMTGLMLLSDPPDREHLRLEWRFDGEAEFNSLWFWDRRGLGTVRLYRNGELAEALGPDNLGPDALTMSAAEWRDRCSRTSRSIKVVLLDQKFVAGIGNLYANEILHRARIHPAQPVDRLTPSQIFRLAAVVRQTLHEAIRYEGSTLNDATYRNVLNRNGRYQLKHRVYNRAGETCPSCRQTVIKRIVQGQRSTFFCPACQKATKRRR